MEKAMAILPHTLVIIIPMVQTDLSLLLLLVFSKIPQIPLYVFILIPTSTPARISGISPNTPHRICRNTPTRFFKLAPMPLVSNPISSACSVAIYC